MIKKERLEELFEKDAPIYRVENNKVCSTKPKKYWSIGEDRIYWTGYKEIYIKFNELFETKEDAEEYAEFGNIPRIEWLELPSWEDVKDVGYDEIFFVKDNRFDSGVVQYYFLVAEQTNQIQIMFREIDHIMTITAYDVIFSKPLTQENYNEARRLCVKLFKGED